LTVTKWQANDETLVLQSDETAVLRWRANLGSIWREGLTPYRQISAPDEDNDDQTASDDGDWAILTSNISEQLLSRITGSRARDWHLSSASSSKRDLESIPGLNAEDLNLTAEQEL
jgi:A1 cistron-splicing factor AAR2